MNKVFRFNISINWMH